MNTMYNLFSTDWAYALGWTLLHSIWQSLLIFVSLLGSLRLISPMRSKLRYALTCGALVLTSLLSITTFSYFIDHSESDTVLRGNAPAGMILPLETDTAKTTA